jgi:hypothetical protein
MRRLTEALVFTTALFAASAVCAQTMDKNVKIGSLGDQSSLYADIGGPGSVIAAQMAVEDSGLLQKGWKIEVISADHQNKPDVGANVARQWVHRHGGLERGPRRVDGGAREKRAEPEHCVRNVGSHQRAVLAEHGSLGL